jgi:hypothetical protein
MPEEFKIADEFIVDLKGKRYPVYAGVLDVASKMGLKNLEVKHLQLPTEQNGWMAVVEAIAVFEDGRTFTDLGDASPKNCSPQIATAAIRMASTRAKGRVLRDAINCGMTLLEELPDENENSPASVAEPRNGARTQSRPQPAAVRDEAPVASDDPDAALSGLVAKLYPPVGEAVCAGRECGRELTMDELRDCAREKLSKPCCSEHLIAYLKKQADKAKQTSA